MHFEKFPPSLPRGNAPPNIILYIHIDSWYSEIVNHDYNSVLAFEEGNMCIGIYGLYTYVVGISLDEDICI